MRRFQCLLLWFLTALLAAGCSGDNASRIKAKGRITKGGQPFTLAQGEGGVRLFLVPSNAADQTRFDSYFAEYHGQDGSFIVLGKDGKGVPPGKYHVHLEHIKHKEDQFHGKLMGANSPLVCEVERDKELLVNLDDAHLDAPTRETPAAAPRPENTRRRN